MAKKRQARTPAPKNIYGRYQVNATVKGSKRTAEGFQVIDTEATEGMVRIIQSYGPDDHAVARGLANTLNAAAASKAKKRPTVTVPPSDADAMRTRRAPRWAWDTIEETLRMDAESSAFDRSLRKQIADALAAVEDVHGESAAEQTFTYGHMENVASLMHSIHAHDQFPVLYENWWEKMEGSKGLYALVISLAVKLDAAADGNWGEGYDWFESCDTVAALLMALAGAGRELPDEAEKDKLIAAALRRSTQAPPPLKYRNTIKQGNAVIRDLVSRGVAREDICPACWSPFIECDAACGAKICACNLSTHDCDEYLDEQPHTDDCNEWKPGPDTCNCIKSMNDDERRELRDKGGK